MVRLARASAVQFGVNIFESFVGVVGTLYIVRTLGFGTFGKYALTLALVNVFLIPYGGVNTATIKRVSERSDQSAYFGAGLLSQLLLSVAVVVVVFVGSGPINDYLGYDAEALVVAFVFLKGLGQLMVSMMQGENRVEEAALVEGGWNSLRSIAQIALVVMGGGLAALVYGELIGAFFAVVLVLVLLTLRPSIPAVDQIRNFLDYAKFAWLPALKAVSYSWTDTIVIGAIVADSVVVGAYEVAWRISILFILLPTAIAKVVFPTISSHSNEGDYEPIRQLLERSLSVATVLAIPGLVGGILLGPEVVGLYGASGREVALASTYLVLLSVARILESYEALFIKTLNGLDLPDRTFRIGLVFFGLNIVLNIALVSLFGASGAAVATIFSVFVSVVLTYRNLPAEVAPSLPRQVLGEQIVSSLVMAAAVSLLVRWIPPRSDVLVVVHVLFGAAVYGAALYALSQTIRERVNQTLTEFVG